MKNEVPSNYLLYKKKMNLNNINYKMMIKYLNIKYYLKYK